MSNWQIPLSDLNYGPEEEAAVGRVLKSKWLSMGPEVESFEKEFAEFIGVKHALAVANATAALHLSLLSLGVGKGDEVIQPALNFVATANMTIAVGATPVFADIVDLEEPTIDPAHVERLITQRSKAVVVMHYGGTLCRMAALVELCRRRGLALVEDACHAIGAGYQEPQKRSALCRRAGAIGDLGAFSFFGNKNLATGEGGMVTTNRDDLAERIRLMRSHGMTTLTWDRHKGHASSYDVLISGYNYRLDEFRAALGREQLKRLMAGNQRRGELTRLYQSRVRELPRWKIPFLEVSQESAFHLMTVLAPDAMTRQIAAQRLRERGIQTSLHYPSIPQFSVFKDLVASDIPLTSDFASRVITLPLYPTMTEAMVETVCSALRDAAGSPT